jgi:acetylornithine deacetylase/succinyl-diaminopimelate desuccinylase-like protein
VATVSIAPEVSRERVVEWLQRFVRYPSEWSPLVEESPAVLGFISDCVGPLVEELGLSPTFDPTGNMIIEAGDPDAGRELMFITYAMTHPASSMTEPFKGELLDRGGRQVVRGRGVSEQKAGIAAALAAFYAAAQRSALKGRLTFVLCTAGETGRHLSVEALAQHMGRVPDLVVVVIGSSGKVSLGNKGRYDILATVRGRAGHSSMPWLGVDAIAGAAKVLGQVGSLDLTADAHAELGSPTLTTTSIESFPKATHTIQNEVRLTFDLRILPGQDPDEAYARVAGAFQVPAPWQGDVDKGALQYPCLLAEESTLVRHIVAGHAAAGLAEPDFFHSHAALDAGFFARQGSEATMWGPGEIEMYHTDDETVAVDDVWDTANAYLGTILSYLG